jgi:hypothetical protein
MEGMAKMSSVSTPYEPSNALPGSEAFCGVELLGVQLWATEAVKAAITDTRSLSHPTIQVKGNVPCSYNVIGIKRFDVRRCNRGVRLALVRRSV